MKIRAHKIAEEIKKETAHILRTELKDPRINGLISITSVEVSGDIRYAKIFITKYGDEQEKKETLQALAKAAGFIRNELGKRIRLRYVPELIFKFDESMEHGAKISAILSQINKQEDSDA